MRPSKIVTVRSFSFTNTAGGTGNSNWQFDPQFTGVAQVRIVTGWYDWEIGQRYIGTAVSQNLIDYLNSNASPSDKRVFFGDRDIVRKGSQQ